MYKLVVIGGRLRGKEFVLSEGANIIGRSNDVAIPLDLDGISKRHVQITINKSSVYIEDMGSSNGTFLNGKLIKKMSGKNGDKLALPNIIFQIVEVREKKVIIKKKVVKEKEDTIVEDDEENDEIKIPVAPKPPLAKMLHNFKYKAMPIVYSFNKEYEWRFLVGVILFAYIIVTISLTIFPVLEDNKIVLLREIKIRGYHYADDIARENAVNLSRRNLEAINTKFLESENGVESYELFDLDGRIVRPLGKLNEYITDTFSIAARDYAVANQVDPTKDRFNDILDDGLIGIAKTIRAYNVKTGQDEAVGVITIKFAPRSLVLEAANNSKAYLESFTTSALVGIILFAILYYMTTRHIDEIIRQTERVLRGRSKEVNSGYKWMELKPLIGTINSLLAKVLESQGDGSEDFGELEDDDKYISILQGFLLGSNGPGMVLNSEKLIQNINMEAEDLTGMRESASIGMSLLDIARDQGFAATVIELCDNCSNNEGKWFNG